MDDEPLMWQLEHIARSRAFRKRLNLIHQRECVSQQLAINLAALLGAVLLIEMHQRPVFVRAAEWTASALIPRKLRRPITRGPLQIADGPWKLNAAIDIAYVMLKSAVIDAHDKDSAIQSAANVWNGKSVRQPCSMYGYGDVLPIAYAVACQASTGLTILPGSRHTAEDSRAGT